MAALPALAVGGALFVRRTVGVDALVQHNDVAGFIYSVVGVIFAVLLGFTAIIVWEQYQNAQEGVEQEANALVDLYRDSRSFPPEVRNAVELDVRTYARLVVEKEWPAMAAGESSSEAWDAFDGLWRTYHEFEPPDDHRRLWYAQSLQRLNALADSRRSRLLSARSGVATVMWGVLIVGGAITIGFSFLFGTRNARAQAIMTACLALTIGVVLLSIVALQNPFAGISRIDPEPFQQVDRLLELWVTLRPSRSPPRGTARGRGPPDRGRHRHVQRRRAVAGGTRHGSASAHGPDRPLRRSVTRLSDRR